MSIDLTPRQALAARIGTLVLLLLSLQMPAIAQSITYIHTDALGTPVAVTDSDRNVIEVSEFEPYGKLLNRPLIDAPGFTGHVSDATTGLSYMQQRYYDPGIGRFLSVDPVTANSGTGVNFNRYWYANNNPYRFTDPDGRWAEDLLIGIPSIVMGAKSLVSNVREGNIGSAVVDVVGIIADVAGTATPGVPGGAGMAIAGARVLNKAADAGKGAAASTKAATAKVGGRVETPDSNPEKFTSLGGGQGMRNNKTNEIWQKSNTNHSGDKVGEFKVGVGGKPPTPSKKITVTRSNCTVSKRDGC